MTESKSNYNNFIIISFGFIMILQLVGILIPDSYSWGFNRWQVVNPYIMYSVFAISLGIIFYLSKVDSKHKYDLNVSTENNYISVFWVIVSIIFSFVLFYLIRPKTLLFGDGATIIGVVASEDEITFVNQLYFQPLTVFLNFYQNKLFTGLLGLEPEQSMAITNIIGGLFGFWAIFRIAKLITNDHFKQLIILFGIFVSSTVILFMGYIENYTWATSMSLWLLYYSLHYYMNNKWLTLLVLFTLLTPAFHMIAIPFSILGLIIIIVKNMPRLSVIIESKITYLVLFFLSALIIYVYHLLNFPPIFLGFTETYYTKYTAFSFSHLIDFANHILLTAPFAILLIVYLIIYRKKFNDTTTIEKIILLCAVLNVIFAFWFDPEIGAVRDWDLLSFYSIPLSLWAISVIVRNLSSKKSRPSFIIILLIVNISLFPNLSLMNSREKSLTYLDDIIWNDLHYSIDYKEGTRLVPWGFIIKEQENAYQRAEKYMRKKHDKFPDSPEASFYLGEIFLHHRQYDSSEYYFDRAVLLDTSEVKYLSFAASNKLKFNKYFEAIRLFEKAIELEPENAQHRYPYAMALTVMGDYDNALEQLKITYDLDSNSINSIIVLSEIYNSQMLYDSAYNYLMILKNNHPEDENIYPAIINTLVLDGNYTEALENWEELNLLNPEYENLDSLKLFIENNQLIP
ncbi:tetratricopeptide repeat protein [Candidatus Zixiibacteriota bacterium]